MVEKFFNVSNQESLLVLDSARRFLPGMITQSTIYSNFRNMACATVVYQCHVTIEQFLFGKDGRYLYGT